MQEANQTLKHTLLSTTLKCMFLITIRHLGTNLPHNDAEILDTPSDIIDQTIVYDSLTQYSGYSSQQRIRV